MGAAHSYSTPPPLVEVNAPGGKVLVPPGTGFTVHPPSYGRSRSETYSRGPVYLPSGHGHYPPVGYGGRHGPLGRRRRSADVDIYEGSEDSESTLADVMEGMSAPGYPRGIRRHGMGRRGLGFVEGMDRRSKSAPEMPLGVYPGMVPMGMGMVSPGMGGMGMNPGGGMVPNGMGGMRPGGIGGMGMPPAYTSNTPVPPYGGVPGGGGVPGTGINPYISHPGRPPSPPPSDSAPEPPRRASARPPGYNERVPMGIYAAEQSKSGKTSRSRTQPQVSSALNRGQPSNRKAGPSGKEWIDGDAFLDACTCNTECKCRKSQRVLYRSRNTRRRSGEFDDNDEEEDVEYGSGEIRYILKDDLGRNCGDHSECTKSDAESDKEVQRDKGKREKRNEEKKRKEEFRGLKEELLEALDERFEGMRKDNHQRGISGNMAAPPFARGDVLPRPFMMDDSGMDPQLAQYMGMMGGDPYGAGLTSLGRMPPGMTGQMRPRSMPPPGVPMGHEAAADMNFEDDMSLANMDGLGPMGMRNPYSTPGMLARKPTRPDFMSVRQAKGSGDFGSAGMHLDPGGLYGQAMRSRKGMLGTRLGGMRRTRPGFGVEDFDVGPSRRPGVRRRGHDDGYETAFESRTRDGHRLDDEDSLPATRRRASSPHGNRMNGRSSRNRGKQARADTDDDDDAY